VATVCPAVATSCPAVATQCPAEQTKCPEALTVCPPPAAGTTCTSPPNPGTNATALAERACPVVNAKPPLQISLALPVVRDTSRIN
jgi:hypothetical protein